MTQLLEIIKTFYSKETGLAPSHWTDYEITHDNYRYRDLSIAKFVTLRLAELAEQEAWELTERREPTISEWKNVAAWLREKAR